MDADYVLLTEKEEMWANMLMEVLKDNGVPCTAVPVHGAGMVMRTGIREKLKVYVPQEHKTRAEELLEELFTKDNGESAQ